MHVHNLSFTCFDFYYSLRGEGGGGGKPQLIGMEISIKTCFNDVCSISNLTFENKNKMKITYVWVYPISHRVRFYTKSFYMCGYQKNGWSPCHFFFRAPQVSSDKLFLRRKAFWDQLINFTLPSTSTRLALDRLGKRTHLYIYVEKSEFILTLYTENRTPS